MKEIIKKIINDGAKKLNKKKKEFVLECAKNLGIEHETKIKCNDCYIDLCFKILNVLKNQNEVAEEKKVKIKLKDGVRVLLNGTPINEVTCDTEEKCYYFLKHGLPKRYFDFYED